MYNRFSLLISIMLLMVTGSMHAADDHSKTFFQQALVKLPHFKTEADISPGKYALAGFAAGCMQQAAGSVLIAQYADNPRICTYGLLFHTLMAITGSISMHDVLAKDVQHLAVHNTECAQMIFNKLHPLHITPNPREAITRELDMRTFVSAYRAGTNHSADVRTAYNNLLESKIKSRSFCKGYFLASILGPLPTVATVAALTELGMISC